MPTTLLDTLASSGLPADYAKALGQAVAAAGSAAPRTVAMLAAAYPGLLDDELIQLAHTGDAKVRVAILHSSSAPLAARLAAIDAAYPALVENIYAQETTTIEVELLTALVRAVPGSAVRWVLLASRALTHVSPAEEKSGSVREARARVSVLMRAVIDTVTDPASGIARRDADGILDQIAVNAVDVDVLAHLPATVVASLSDRCSTIESFQQLVSDLVVDKLPADAGVLATAAGLAHTFPGTFGQLLDATVRATTAPGVRHG